MDNGWQAWLFLAVYLFLMVKAYQFLRRRFGSRDGSGLEFWGAWYWCGLVAFFMPFIWIYEWARRPATDKAEQPSPNEKNL